MQKSILVISMLLLSFFETPFQKNISNQQKTVSEASAFIVVLGVAQDAGYPHPHCDKACCAAVYNGREKAQHVTCLGVVDAETQQAFMIEATPDFTLQERQLRGYLKDKSQPLSGILLTHAHIGHYTGLMYLGREAIGAKALPVFAMPKMRYFIENNAPWVQLARLKNIALNTLTADSVTTLSKNIAIKPIIVPHRDEFSETVGFIIISPQKRVLFIPDIDKWEKWQQDIRTLTQQVDIALLDGTFYKNGEIPNRDMREIPHPFMEETMQLFENKSERHKIHFIHFNHTNPVIRRSPARKYVLEKGFKIATEGMVIPL